MTEIEAPADGWNERIVRLERRNQRMTGVVVLLVIVALTQTVWNLMPGSSTISATHFVLRKGSGPPRGEFYLWDDGTPALRLNNPNGEARALWALRSDGTLSLRLSDAGFIPRAEMSVDPGGLPAITLSGSDGRSHARLSVNAGNQALLEGVTP
jgi:hypothetical protein